MLKCDPEKLELIKKFLSKRPEAVAVFGYGSGVFEQAGKKDKVQIDLIIVPENAKKWHLANMKMNPKDYSFTGKLFFGKLPECLHNLGTPISFITNLSEGNTKIKIGVISKKNLLTDLKKWKSFYLAGRFQKPNLPIKTDEELTESIDQNRKNALTVALLLLDEDKHNLKELYMTLCRLSYMGDIRMLFAENPRKVRNIVEGSFDELNEMYTKFGLFKVVDEKGKIEINYEKLIDNISNIPLKTPKCLSKKEHLKLVKKLIEIRLSIKNLGHTTVQSLKGLVTAGPIKSLAYLYRKITKRFSKE